MGEEVRPSSEELRLVNTEIDLTVGEVVRDQVEAMSTGKYCLVAGLFNQNSPVPKTSGQSSTHSPSIKQLCHEVLQEEFLVIRKTAKLLGKFTSSFPAVRFGPLHYRSLERVKILALKFAKGNFDKKMKVLQAGKMDILWRINNIEDSVSPIQIPNCSFLLKTDASKLG